MQPPAAIVDEDAVPVHIPRFELRDRGMAAIGATHRSPQSKSSLGEIQAVAGLPPYAIVRNPLDIGLVDSPLVDQVLNQPANGVIDERGDDGGIQPKAALETTRNVVFAAALPHPKFPRVGNPGFSGIETQHHFSQSNQVPTA